MPIIHRDTDYALRALLHLARRGEEEVVSASNLAEEVCVPVDFMRKVMQVLKAERFVDSAQGPFGGYSLRRDPENINVLQVVEAVQGPIIINACFGEGGGCELAGCCGLREALGGAQKVLRHHLKGITLQDVLGRSERLRYREGTEAAQNRGG